MAAITAMIVPPLGRALPRGALGTAAAELRAVLRVAASQAIAEGRTIVFHAEPGTGYWLDNVQHRLGAPSEPAPPPRHAPGGNGGIAFYPWGGSSGGRLWLENAAGRRAIDVDTVSGRAVIIP